jgi:3-deoxy-7-phosphoheptulonate synthase
MSKTDDTRIARTNELVAPEALIRSIPASEVATAAITQGRNAIHRVLADEDQRLVVVVGPCSIHDPEAARDYAARLQGLATELQEQLIVYK